MSYLVRTTVSSWHTKQKYAPNNNVPVCLALSAPNVASRRATRCVRNTYLIAQYPRERASNMLALTYMPATYCERASVSMFRSSATVQADTHQSSYRVPGQFDNRVWGPLYTYAYSRK